MAHCVISAVVDTDDPRMPVMPACVVHTHWAPCPLNGDPASVTPLHAADGDPDRESAVKHWRMKTHGQRPMWLHHDEGGWLGPKKDTGQASMFDLLGGDAA